MPSPAESERLRLEAEADADFEFEQAQKAAAPVQPPAPKQPKLTYPTPFGALVSEKDVADLQARAAAAPPSPPPVAEPPPPKVEFPLSPAGIKQAFSAFDARSPEQRQREEVATADQTGKTYIQAPTPLAVARRVTRAASGLVGGIAGESTLGRGVDVASAYAEQFLDPMATYQEKIQHRKDIAEAVNKAANAKGTVVELGGGSEGEAASKALDLLKEGNIKEAARSVTPAAWLAPYSATQQAREKQAIGGVSAAGAAGLLGNIAGDIFNNIAGLSEAANAVAGFTVEEEGKRRGGAAYEAGKGLAEMPGAAANLAKGVADLSGSNSLLTMPVSTWMMVADPLRKSVRAIPGEGGAVLNAKMDAVGKAISDAVSGSVDAGVEAARAKFPKQVEAAEAALGSAAAVKNALRNWFEDGLSNGDKRIAGELDSRVNGSGESAAIITANLERIQNEVAAGRSQLVRPNLVEVTPELRGAPAKGAALRAAREARAAAVAEAEKVAGLREGEVGRAEVATDRAADRADVAGERMGAAEGAASEKGLRAAALRDQLQQGLEKATVDTVDAKLERAAERQGKAEGMAERARERQQRANEAYDEANAKQQDAEALETAARAEYNDAVQTTDTLREKAAAITGKDKFAANAALEKALADAQGAGVKLQEAVRQAERARIAARDIRSELEAQRREAIANEQQAATRAAAEDVRRVEGAGETVSAGRQWGPAGTPGDQIVSYDEALAAASAADEATGNPAHLQIIKSWVDRTEQARQEALIAGFDPRAPIDPEIAKALPRHEGKTVLELGREVAHQMTEDNLGGSRDVAGELSGALVNIGVPEKAARLTAEFLDAEQKLKRATHMLEREGGAIRRPTPRVETYVAEGGKLGPAGQAAADLALEPLRRRLLEDNRPLAERLESEAPEPLVPVDLRKEGYNTLSRMESVAYPEEAPASFVSRNPVINEALENIYQEFQKAYRPDWELTGDSVETIARQFDKVPAIGNVVLQGVRDLKMLSKDRIFQRVLEAVEDQTAQLTRSPTVRNAYLRQFTENASKLGLPKEEISQLRGQFLKMLEDPSNWTSNSKNIYQRIVDGHGRVVWDTGDYMTALERVDPKRLNRIRGDVITQVGGEMADAVHGYSIMRSLADMLYAPFYEEGGKFNPQILKSIPSYMERLVQNERAGKAPPVAYLYSAERMLAQLVEQAKSASPEELPAIRSLAKQIQEANIRPAVGSSLGDNLPQWYKEQFRSTDLPVDLTNLHMPDSVLTALGAHFAMLSGVKSANLLVRAVYQVLSASKANIVAASIPSLINNNLSNFFANILRRGDPAYAAKVVQSGIITQLWLHGAYDKMSPETAADMRALAKTDLRSSTFVESELKRHQYRGAIGKILADKAPDLLRRAQDIDYAMRNVPSDIARGGGRIRDGLLWAYQELGDMPFRVEQALHSMRQMQQKFNMLEPGATIDVPVSAQRFIRVERLEDGRYRLTDPMRAKSAAPAVVEAGSDVMRDLSAKYGNLVQGERFFDYNKIGTVAKWMRTPYLAPFTGIFTWYFSALDLPFVKRGLVKKMMFEGDSVPTTSPAVRAVQNRDAFRLAYSRAALSSQANNMMRSQEGNRELGLIASMSHSDPGTMLAKASDPAQAFTRNISPVVFAKPTLTVLQGVEAALQHLAFDDVLKDPVQAQQLLTPTEEDLAKRAAMPLAERRAEETRVRELRKMALGQTFTLDDFLTVIGASGSPAVTLFYKWRDGKLTTQAAQAQFIAMMLGKTPAAVLDTLVAGTGMALQDPKIISASSYSNPAVVAGIRGGVGGEDVSDFPQWMLSTLLSLGWKTTDILGAENAVTGRDRLGAIANVTNDAQKTMKEKWLAPMVSRKSAAMRLPAGPERDREVEKADENMDAMEKVIKDFFKSYRSKLKDDYKSMRQGKVEDDVIQKEGKDFKVVAESGKPMGTYPTQEAAKRRLAQIEMFKSMKAKGNV